MTSNRNLFLKQLDVTALIQELGTMSAMAFPDDTIAINTYLGFVMQSFQMRTAFISELSESALYVRASVDEAGCTIPADTIIPLQESFCQYVRATSAPVVISDAASDPRVTDVETRRDYTIGSYIGVPLLLTDGSLYGTVCVLDPDPREFTDMHIAILRVVARQLAAIVERATTRPIMHRAYEGAAADVATTLAALDVQTLVARVVAHDVSSPLMVIYGYSDLLKNALLGPLTDEQQAAVQCIQQASQMVNRLITDLSDADPQRNQTFTLITGQIDPVTLAREVVEAYRPQANSQGLQLSLEHPAVVPFIIGDADRLKQVLHNLLSNAFRYTKQGWVRLGIDTYAGGVEFRVEDNGMGIAPEIQDAIWARYTRGTSIGKGVGLGLYVVQELVTAMGGTVGLTSAVGAGSCFWIRLPHQGSRPQLVKW